MRSGDIGRKPLPVVVGVFQDFAEKIPFAGQKRGARVYGLIAYTFKDLEYLCVAVYVALCDLPVIYSRVARLTGVADHDPTLEGFLINVESLPRRAFDAEVNGRNAAEL